MKKAYLSVLVTLLFISLQGCISNKRFSNTILVDTTDLKHQKMTGQCWAFASTSLLEAETLRLGYDIPEELSTFFFVYHNYLENARDYIINNGKSRLNRGDLTFSVLEIFENYGAVPESIYDGNLGTIVSEKQMRNRWKQEDEMNALIKVKLDSLIQTDLDIDASLKIIKKILNTYIGEAPETFTYLNNQITPIDFAKKYLPLNIFDYVEMTSYNHHPFYENILLEIPANWRHKTYLNLPIEDFIGTIDNAINNDFSLAWDGDIGYEEGFKDNGYVANAGHSIPPSPD